MRASAVVLITVLESMQGRTLGTSAALVAALAQHPDFTLANPNRARALEVLRTFLDDTSGKFGTLAWHPVPTVGHAFVVALQREEPGKLDQVALNRALTGGVACFMELALQFYCG